MKYEGNRSAQTKRDSEAVNIREGEAPAEPIVKARQEPRPPRPPEGLHRKIGKAMLETSRHEQQQTSYYLSSLDRDRSGFCLLVLGLSKKIYLVEGNQVRLCFSVAIGENGLGKTKEGDKKTPLGDYHIKWMVSRNGPPKKNPDGQNSFVVDGETYAIRDTELYFGKLEDAGLSEEELKIAQDEKLWTAAYGGENVFVMALDYPNEQDRREGRTGSSIEIHASVPLGQAGFERHKGTLGCVALIPDHASGIYAHVNPGTPVRIVRD